MKRSITRWTTTLATAALLGLPAAGFAQSPSTTPPRESPAPPTQQQPTPEPPSQPSRKPAEPTGATPSPTPSAQSTSAAQSASPDEHLVKAKAALDAIPGSSLKGDAKKQVGELKKHLKALDKAASASSSESSPGAASKDDKWSTEVAAMDRILGELLASNSAAASPSSPAPSATPGAAGTSGSSKSTEPAALDEATRASLTEVKTQISAYAAAKGGAGTTTPKGGDEASAAGAAAGASSAMTPSPSALPTASRTPAEPTAEPTPASPPSASSAAAEPQATPPAPESQATPPASQAAAPAQAGSQPGTPSPDPAAQSAVQAQPAGDTDPEAARRALTAARESLSQLTQLPAAGQLTGPARTQVAQLISNFNELITTQVQWRASYAKVSSSLDALLGPESTEASATPAPTATPGAAGTAGATPPAAEPGAAAGATPASPTPGAVGTSGSATTQIDPSIKAKLLELKKNLADFEKASGGSAPAPQ